MKVKLYIEGGGESQLQDTQFRAGWRRFFEKAGLKGRMPAVFRGRSRSEAYDAYCTAVALRRQGEMPLLLVDSEDLVSVGQGAWAHLKQRDGWSRPRGSGLTDVFLMICCMETWLVADRATLMRFFPEWIDRQVPKWPKLEQVEKDRVLDALKRATSKCAKKYAKGQVSFELLGEIDPKAVEAACPAAMALLTRLRQI